MSAAHLKVRIAQLDWSLLSSTDQLNDLKWVDSHIQFSHQPFIEKDHLFAHRPYGYFLPPAMVEAAQKAQAYGEPTVLEGLLLLNAKVEWLIETRKYLWSPLSPVPKLLDSLADAFGISCELHQNKPDVLLRLAAVLPKWYPHRGTVQRARFLIEKTIGIPLKVGTQQKGSKPMALDNEAMMCRSVTWWRHRSSKRSQSPNMRIKDGILQFQPDDGQSYPALIEDTVVEWCKGDEFPVELTRLLPPYGSVRLIIK